MKLLGIAAIVGASTSILVAQSPSAETEIGLRAIQPDIIRAHMQFLASDQLEGRGTATRGYQLAANYVAAQFKTLGLVPVQTNSYFQSVSLWRVSLDESGTSLVSVSDQHPRAWTFGKDFLVFGSAERDQIDVTGDVVFVGYGITAPELNYDDYAGVNVRGRIVAVLSDPPPFMSGDAGTFYSLSDERTGMAAEHGAAAILYLSERDEPVAWRETLRLARGGSFNLRGNPAGTDAFAFLSAEASAALFEGAPQSWRDLTEAAKAGRRPHLTLPVRTTLKIRSQRRTQESPNVIGMLRGSGGSNEYVVYAAHLDHLGISDPVDGDRIYNGAIDNASGIAGMLAIARAFGAMPTKPLRSVLFLATTGEESGQLGSEYFVEHPPVALSGMVAALNIDAPTIMRYPVRGVRGMGATNSSLGSVLNTAAQQLSLEVRQRGLEVSGSDHVSFVHHGVPTVYLLQASDQADQQINQDWMDRIYHSPKDDMNQPLDYTTAVTMSQLYFLLGEQIANDQHRPSWNPGDFLGTRSGGIK